jgi:hypothetical protein
VTQMAIQVVFIDDASGRRVCMRSPGSTVMSLVRQADQPASPDRGNRHALKGHHPIVFRNAPGTLLLDGERARVYPCAEKSTGAMGPLAVPPRERVSPEMLYPETRFATLVSHGLTARLLGEFPLLDRPIGAERLRRHRFQVADTREAEFVLAPVSKIVDERIEPNNVPPHGPLFVGMDGGYVRGRVLGRFEVIAGKSPVSFYRDGRGPDSSGRCFAFVQTVDTRPRARLVDTLRRQGMWPYQQIVFLSEGAETLRRLRRNISPEAERTCWTGSR